MRDSHQPTCGVKHTAHTATLPACRGVDRDPFRFSGRVAAQGLLCGAGLFAYGGEHTSSLPRKSTSDNNPCSHRRECDGSDRWTRFGGNASSGAFQR